MKNSKGIFPALFTPYKKDGSVNYDMIKQLTRKYINDGVDGFYVCGSNGEAFMLSDEERMKILETVVEENNGEKTVICHVGAIGTDQSVNFAKHAYDNGADYVSAVSPFYYKFSETEMKEHYLSIAEATPLKFIIYNFPGLTGFEVTCDFLKELLKSGKIAGVKHTSNNLFSLQRMKELSSDITILNGFDELLLSGLVAGADGGIGSTYNCAPRLYVELYKAFVSGDFKKAQLLQAKANDMIELFISLGVMQAQKASLDILGYECNGARRPFKPLSQEGVERLKQFINSTDIIG